MVNVFLLFIIYKTSARKIRIPNTFFNCFFFFFFIEPGFYLKKETFLQTCGEPGGKPWSSNLGKRFGLKLEVKVDLKVSNKGLMGD